MKGNFLTEFLKYHGPTDAMAGKTLTDFGRQLGFTERVNPVFGKTVRSWATGGHEAPLWAQKTACCYIVNAGYIPESVEDMTLLLSVLEINGKSDLLRPEFEKINFSKLTIM